METLSVHKHPTGISIFIGVLLILAGLFAITLPFLAGIAASIFFGWLILIAGVAHLIYAWSERGAGSILLQVLIGIVYLLAAFYMLSQPARSLLTLTLILAVYIGVEGIFELVIYSRWRRLPGSSWFLIDGLISLLLAGLIWFHWPSSSLWAIGTLVGISLIFSGIARFSMPSGRRRLLAL
jgi:uncharacterized membrane protein HdeD (DUF308 family)